jgi:hypothetical protein
LLTAAAAVSWNKGVRKPWGELLEYHWLRIYKGNYPTVQYSQKVEAHLNF